MKTQRQSICILAVILLVAVIPNRLLAEARVDSNVIIGMYSGLAQVMDVHYPAEPNGYAIVVIPGSGWTAPLSPDARPLKDAFARPHYGSQNLLDAGYTLFFINHRAAPRFRYPAPVEDAQRAVRHVRHNAETYGINAERIGAFGGSSGGHLVSMLGTMDGDGVPDDPSPINRESSKVQTVVALFPATDFIDIARNRDQGAPPLFGAALGRRQLDNNPDSEEERIYREASPTTYVSRDDPPFLLIHGDEDPVVPYTQSEALEAALKESEVPVTLIRMPGGGHGARVSAGPNAPDYFGPMVEWFDRFLREES